jgi:DUF4097 and DUF4098 domain-containing protein YvlB
MPTFATPHPLSVTLDLAVADLRIGASERADTVVEVRPSNAAKAADIRAAERTEVEYANGRLLVSSPRQRGIFGRAGSIAVTIELPAGSHMSGEVAVGAVRAEGQLGECALKVGVGAVRLAQTGTLKLNTGSGNVTVERAVGQVEITTGSGTVRVREIDGPATIKNSNGETAIGDVTGDLRLSAANGRISVERAHASVTAKTANGDVKIGEVVRGAVVLETAHGGLAVGIREGSAAWLDVRTHYGRVRNSLRAEDGPQPADEQVEVRARTSYGDITIYRSTAATW